MQNVLYHYAVAVSLSTSLFEVDNDERPHPHDVADDLHKRRHRQLPSNDGTAKTRSGHHPFAMFGPLQSRDDEFRHGEGIQRPKDGGRHLLQTALEETQVENRVFHQLVRVPTYQVLLVSVCHQMRPPEIATRDAELPTAATTDPSTATSCVASTVKRSTSTATRRKVPFSQVRMKAHTVSPRSSNSRP